MIARRPGFSAIRSLGVLPCALLLLLASFPGQALAADREEALARAQEQVEAGDYDSALEIFRQLAAADPQDLEARIWIARLESWQGNYELAERLYREVLQIAPGNLEAELGLVDVLSWQGRYREAEERLEGLEAADPRNVTILLRQAKLARWQGRRKEARDGYQKVLEVDPGNPEAEEALEAIRLETRYRLATGYFLEEFDFVGNANGQFVEFLYHDLDRVWLLGRFTFQNKFDQNNTRYTLGGTYRFFSRTWVRAQVSLAPSGDTVVANQDYTLEVTQGLRPPISVGAGYRFLDFQAADVHVVTALVNWDPRPDLHLFVRYTPARTTFTGGGGSVWNQNGWARLVWDVNRTFSPYLLFAVGSESFTGLSADELGRFAAQTWGAGVEVRVTKLQGFSVGYYRQNRTRDNRQQGFSLSYFIRF